jgi:hypothetical protein
MAFVAVIHNNHLTFNGKHYFRGSAESIAIGTYGEKKTPAFGANYLEAQADLPAERLVVNVVTTVDIDFTKSKAADIKVGLKVAGTGGSGDAAFTDLKSGKLKLVKFEMRLGELATAVNNSPAVRNNLRDYGADARVANEIFVILEASLAQTFTTAGSISFTRTTAGLKASVTAGGSSSGTTTVTLSAGTTYAYLLAKPDWNSGKSRIEKFTDDQWGLT